MQSLPCVAVRRCADLDDLVVLDVSLDIAADAAVGTDAVDHFDRIAHVHSWKADADSDKRRMPEIFKKVYRLGA